MGMAFPQSLSDVVIGEAITHRNLTLVPLLGPQTGPEVTPLARALLDNKAEVSEVSESGDVNRLLVVNKGGLGLLLFDGEELIGAKQNRIVNTSVVVAAESREQVPVSCIERGRWARKSQQFSSQGRTMPSTMRRNKSTRIHQSLIERGHYDADQSATWRDVDAYSARRQVTSATDAMSDILDADHRSIEDYVQGIGAVEGQCGAAIYINGELMGIDLLGRSECYVTLHEQLLRGYAADALERRNAPVKQSAQDVDPKRVLAGLQLAPMTTHQPPGVGTNLQIDAAEHVASALLIDNELVHLAAFPKQKAA